MTRYKNLFGLQYTEGIRQLAEEKGAFWLIDTVESHQTKKVKEKDYFQLWRLEKMDGGTWRLSMRRDTNEPVEVFQEIEYSDFPENEFEFYVCMEGATPVMLLKSEY